MPLTLTRVIIALALQLPPGTQTEKEQLIEFELVPKDFQPSDGKSAKLVVFGKRFPSVPLDFATKDAQDSMLAAAIDANRSGSLARILAAWYIGDRPSIEAQLKDPKTLEKNTSLARSVSKVIPLTKIFYGKYVVYLLSQQYTDGRYLPTVFPMRSENGTLWITNDLRDDPLLMYLFVGLARRLQTQFITNNASR